MRILEAEDVFRLSEIFVYPVKGLQGIRLEKAFATSRGIQYDRKWMLVDQQGRFLSQREIPLLSQFAVSLEKDGIQIISPNKHSKLFIDFSEEGQRIPIEIWDDSVMAALCSSQTSQWFSDILNIPVRMVRMPDDVFRQVDPKYVPHPNPVGFADGFPFLLCSHSSLAVLNQKLEEKITMQRFRPNLVFSGGVGFEEDHFGEFSIGNISFQAIKPCARCHVITIDPDTGNKGQEPLRTLGLFRARNNKVMFGENVILIGNEGWIEVGMPLKVLSVKA